MADEETQFQVWLKETHREAAKIAHCAWGAFFRKTVRAIQDDVRAAVDEAYLLGNINAELADRIEGDIGRAIENAIDRSIATEVCIEYPRDDDEGAAV